MGIYNGNLITVAVKDNKPELITSHSSFDVNTLTVDGCGLINFNYGKTNNIRNNSIGQRIERGYCTL